MSETLLPQAPPDNTTTKEAVKKVDDGSHTYSLVEHLETEGKELHVTSGGGMATPAPVSISVMQMIAGRLYLGTGAITSLSLLSEELEQMEAEINRELFVYS